LAKEERVYIRCTKAEKQLIKHHANTLGLDISDLTRKLWELERAYNLVSSYLGITPSLKVKKRFRRVRLKPLL